MLTFTVRNLGDVTIFHCKGRITCDNRDSVRDAVLAVSHTRIVVLDLAGVAAIDAAGLGLLVFLRSWADSAGTELKLMNLMPRVEEVFALTNLRSVFEICSLQDLPDLVGWAPTLSDKARVPERQIDDLRISATTSSLEPGRDSAFVPSLIFLWRSPHSAIMVRIGTRVSPYSVKEYSTSSGR